ncbi:MAG TPA: UDP-2,3-diacylglucosamine diphosphatase [Steroidobacteraceae bacterium]|nr:UDP-2,3-diacylglucosamine diphosphatase [Steroidobacteraceae bacterium]
MAQLFVSDLHLDASAPEATGQFLDFLATHAAKAEALYVLGDLFEAWIGDDDPHPEKRRVCDGLRALTNAGVPCFLLHGNRDFLIGSGFEARTGARVLPDPVIAQVGDEAVLLTHGDLLCIDDHAYQELRAIVRTARWQRRFLALPLAVREHLADQARAGSRAHTSRTVPYVMDVNGPAVEAAFRATGVRTLIHGHTHRPGIHELVLDGASLRRIVLGAWYEQGSYLVSEGGRFELRTLERP